MSDEWDDIDDVDVAAAKTRSETVAQQWMPTWVRGTTVVEPTARQQQQQQRNPEQQQQPQPQIKDDDAAVRAASNHSNDNSGNANDDSNEGSQQQQDPLPIVSTPIDQVQPSLDRINSEHKRQQQLRREQQQQQQEEQEQQQQRPRDSSDSATPNSLASNSYNSRANSSGAIPNPQNDTQQAQSQNPTSTPSGNRIRAAVTLNVIGGSVDDVMLGGGAGGGSNSNSNSSPATGGVTPNTDGSVFSHQQQQHGGNNNNHHLSGAAAALLNGNAINRNMSCMSINEDHIIMLQSGSASPKHAGSSSAASTSLNAGGYGSLGVPSGGAAAAAATSSSANCNRNNSNNNVSPDNSTGKPPRPPFMMMMGVGSVASGLGSTQDMSAVAGGGGIDTPLAGSSSNNCGENNNNAASGAVGGGAATTGTTTLGSGSEESGSQMGAAAGSTSPERQRSEQEILLNGPDPSLPQLQPMVVSGRLNFSDEQTTTTTTTAQQPQQPRDESDDAADVSAPQSQDQTQPILVEKSPRDEEQKGQEQQGDGDESEDDVNHQRSATADTALPFFTSPNTNDTNDASSSTGGNRNHTATNNANENTGGGISSPRTSSSTMAGSSAPTSNASLVQQQQQEQQEQQQEERDESAAEAPEPQEQPQREQPQQETKSPVVVAPAAVAAVAAEPQEVVDAAPPAPQQPQPQPSPNLRPLSPPAPGSNSIERMLSSSFNVNTTASRNASNPPSPTASAAPVVKAQQPGTATRQFPEHPQQVQQQQQPEQLEDKDDKQQHLSDAFVPAIFIVVFLSLLAAIPPLDWIRGAAHSNRFLVFSFVAQPLRFWITAMVLCAPLGLYLGAKERSSLRRSCIRALRAVWSRGLVDGTRGFRQWVATGMFAVAGALPDVVRRIPLEVPVAIWSIFWLEVLLRVALPSVVATSS